RGLLRRGLPLRDAAQRRRPDARPRLPAAAGGAAALRLEECEVGAGRRVHGGGPAGVLGELGPRRLPHARRPRGRAALPPRLRVPRPRPAVSRLTPPPLPAIYRCSIRFRCFSPQSFNIPRTDRSVSPNGVREYSTFGGTSGYTSRWTIPSRSNSRRCCVSIR